MFVQNPIRKAIREGADGRGPALGELLPALKGCQAVDGQAKTDTPQWNADGPGWHQASDKGSWCVLLINSLATWGLATLVLVTGGLCSQERPPSREDGQLCPVLGRLIVQL